MEKILVHPTAIIHPDAILGKNVEVGAYSIIEGEVSVGDGTWIDSHVIIKGKTTIGKNNRIGAHSTLGFPAQDKDHVNEPTTLEIGDNNDIREYVSMHTGTFGGSGITKLGNNNQIMGYTHLAHDVWMGDYCMAANAVQIAGHAHIGNRVVFGGLAGVHQHVHIGDFCMIGGASAVMQDLSPFLMANGQRARIIGVNKVGLRRNGFSKEEIRDVNNLVKIFFKQGLPKEKAIIKLKEELPDGRILNQFLSFIEKSTRGLMR